MTIRLAEFGANITNEIIGEQIYNKIHQNLDNADIEIDFEGIHVMTTYCAKQIFGRLKIELGDTKFYNVFSFSNADDNIKYIISVGLSE